MLVFGWSSFEIGHYTPSTLGLPNELDAEYLIEFRQKYFHLFYIPFFPLEQQWALRKKSDNQLYEANGDLLKFLVNLPIQHKTPWYTYALIWILLVGGIGYFVNEKIKDYNAKQARETKDIAIIKAIEQPEHGTYFKLEDSRATIIFLKFLEEEKGSLICLMRVKERGGYYDTYDYLLPFLPDTIERIYDTVEVKKSALVDCLKKKRAGRYGGTEFVEVIEGVEKLSFIDIMFQPFPFFREVTTEYANGTYRSLLQNIGSEGTIQGVLLDSSKTSLRLDFIKKPIRSGDTLLLTGLYKESEPRLDATFQFEDLKGKKGNFRVHLKGIHFSMENKEN